MSPHWSFQFATGELDESHDCRGQPSLCRPVPLSHTPYANNWIIYHDALSSWWSKTTRDWSVSMLHSKTAKSGGWGTRYELKLPGDTPEYMPLNSNLFSDLEMATTSTDLICPPPPGHGTQCPAMVPFTHTRIVEDYLQDIASVFTAIDQVVEAKGVAVGFTALRRGRRLLEHQRSAAKMLKESDFGTIKNLLTTSTCKTVFDWFMWSRLSVYTFFYDRSS